ALFAQQDRAFSSGCIRVKDPFDLAELVLDDPDRWGPEQIRQAVATGATRTVHLEKPLTVLVLYWTAEVAPDGTARFFKDIYGRDKRIIAGLDRPFERRQ
ncbi:MAG: murein L,D-transpeptidase, partial [Gammaproteobacteria bacterium]|nr:murein L,D-transpeptidase [Gammaproteobacteria bacterium]NNM01614.1 murein L,D-transpeptidase [Gammaproteobacteria bacterium]